MKKDEKYTKRIALSGVLAAMTVAVLALATAAPTSKLSLYALSSFFISIIIMEFGIASGWAFYVVSGLLALLVVPGKLGVAPYLAFFGVYGALKYYIERLGNIFFEYAIKIVYFNFCLTAAFLLAEEILFKDIAAKFPVWAIIIILQILFIVYDYVYSLFISYYREKIRGKLRL